MNRIALVITIMLLLLPTVQAADIKTSDTCTLADAITAANTDEAAGNCAAGDGADIISLSGDITLTTALPQIVSEITIEGNGFTISGNNRYRIFYNDGGALNIYDLTITNGYVEGDLIRNADESLKNATANPIGGAIVNWQGTVTISGGNFGGNLAEYDGGAIYNRGGELSISNSVFGDNLADEDGGAITNWRGRVSISDSIFSDNSADSSGGAIANWGELSIVNSAFSGNSAEWNGGAIFNGGIGELNISDSAFSHNSSSDLYAEGGAIFNWGELSIVNSTFSGNSADADGGAIANGTTYKRGGELSIVSSAFSHNSARWNGGAINNLGELSITSSTFSNNLADDDGGAIYNEEELSIVNSTFSGNSADKGGAIYNEEELSIVNSTFSGNKAGLGGAIFNGEDGKLRMRNSIIAGRGCYSESRIRQNIGNFIQGGSCSPAFKGDPMLGELVEPDDGSPAYYPLLEGSPAIDAADDEYCPDTDMLGTARPQGAACDIGAYERPQ